MKAEGKLEAGWRRIGFLGMTAAAASGTAGIGLSFWESLREWGSLPSAAGSGILLYSIVGVALLALWAGAGYAWYQSRQPL